MDHQVLAPGIVKFDLNKVLVKTTLDLLKSLDNNLWEDALTLEDVEGNLNNRYKGKLRNSDIFYISENFRDLSKKIEFEAEQKLFSYKILHAESEVMTQAKETFYALRYNPGDHYKLHSDSSSRIYRLISCIVYLNPTEYEGGSTYFKYFDFDFKAKEPCIIFFPSNYIYAHTAMPVQQGTKYVLVNWYSDLSEVEGRSHGYQDISQLKQENFVIINDEPYFKLPKGKQ